MRIERAPGPALPGPFAAPAPSAGIQPTVATVALARRQVRELLLQAPAFRRLEPVQRRRLAHGLVRIAAYLAELVRDDWKQSEACGRGPATAGA